MFHKHLEQDSKRFTDHPNVAALYISLPKDKARRPEEHPLSPAHLPKIRDFAYDQLDDPALSTDTFIAAFTDSGFRSHHRRINNGDILSKAGVLGYEKTNSPLHDHPPPPPVDHLKVRLPRVRDRDDNDRAARRQKRPTSEETRVDSVASDPSGTTAAGTPPPIAAVEVPEKKEKSQKSKGKRGRKFPDKSVIVAVAVCMLEYMN